MRKAVKVLLTFVLAVTIVGASTVMVYSYPVIIMGGTLFLFGGIPGGTISFEVNIPWPYLQMHVIVDVYDLLYLDVPGPILTGIWIYNLGVQIASVAVDEVGTYDFGWIDSQGACNITLSVYGYLTLSRMEGRITVWARGGIAPLFYGDFLVVNDKLQQ